MKLSNKIVSLIALFLPLSFATTNVVETKAIDESFNPIIQYKFDDEDNLGKDCASSFNLTSFGNVTKTTDGIYLDGNSFLYYSPIGTKDFTDCLDAFTITVWAKEDAVQSFHRFIVGSGCAYSNTGFGLGFYETNRALIAPTMDNGYADDYVTSSKDNFEPHATDYNDSLEWNCFTIMLQNGTSYFGVNGHIYAIKDSIDMSLIANSGQTFTIGGVASNSVTGASSAYNKFVGEIADLRIYNDILSASEFQSIYSAGIKGANTLTRKNSIKAINNTKTGGYHYDIECGDLSTTGILNAVKDLSVSLRVSEYGSSKDINGNIIWTNLNISSSEATIDGFTYLKGYAVPSNLFLKVHLYKAMYTNIKLNTTFTNNMVLQRNSRVKIFGYGGDINENVTVSFAGQSKTGVVTSSGWEVYLDPMKENKVGQNLTITYKSQTITLTDVVIGDVLLCSGQSNMAITVQYILNKRAAVEDEYKTLDNYKNIRVYDSSSVYLEKSVPTIYDDSLGREWKKCTDFNSVKNYSAYAMAAASNYSSIVGEEVPVGVIVAAIGGSCIEEWCDPVGVTTFHSYASEMGKVDSRFYNAYIYNLAGYTVSAFLWNQGCANSQPKMVDDYKIAFKVLINHLRDLFEDENLPVIVQQLPQFDSWCETYQIRLAQWEFMNTNNEVYTINGFDTGDMDPTDGIHATDKWILGQRVAGALAYAFGIKKSEMLNPNLPYGVSNEIETASWYKENDKTIIEINAGDVVWTSSGQITGFELKSNDTWSSATGYIKDGKIYISTSLEKVSYLRYNLYTGYIESGSSSYAKTGVAVFPYDGEGLPLAISGEVKITQKVNPTPTPDPEPEPEPEPDPKPTDDKKSLSPIAIAGIIGGSVVLVSLIALGIILVIRFKH